MTWDYIIVGAGSAGCALAYELARSDRNKKILVLEAGGMDSAPSIRLAAAQTQAVAKHDWGYRSQPDPSRYGATERWPRGRVIGGSSSINGTMFVRGAAGDFDRWAQLTRAPSWAAKHVMPIFRELETSDQAGPLRGHNGPLHVRTVKHPHQISTAFVEAATRSGYRLNADYNGEVQEGVGYAQLSQRKGLRCSAADAFLRPILRLPNVELLPNASALRLELTKGQVTAVICATNDRERRIVGREVIVCAGAINSPKLLLASGIGEPGELERLGIPVALALPGVGNNLKEHPLLKLVYRTRIPTSNLSEGWLHKLRLLSQFVVRREGPLSNLFEAAGFLRSSGNVSCPDIQLHFLTFGYATKPDGTSALAPYPSVTVLLNKSYPLSRGRIRLASADPRDPPLIECRLLEQEEDVETMVRGVRLVREIMSTAPMANIIEEETEPGVDFARDVDLKAYVRRRTGIAFHPAGTCRMGSDAQSVVGADLRVHGTSNLWIADASVMPDLISGNTNAVCMMIGAKLGKQFSAATVDGRRVAHDNKAAVEHLQEYEASA